ncbi:transglycosylase SLT domain-containing protein [Pseudoduganella eburnea]|uniref:Transglycosylase SLT domain-containing protein n=1 Tax=Massilia eburnea TaxID=1776165 RepID=A0A6L6QPQ2_9BURK|nr:transglycosylase SLT domain-containing protein [Massilia eburnea]MTW14342.1 transglycosylase SLT domain-containing protein [Massilia eburnea]
MRFPAAVAATLLAHAACAQNAATLFDQAQRLEHGEGVTRDLDQAAALYCRAARLGAPEAQYALGWMYANGRGVAHDDGVAWRLFGLAAEQGYAAGVRMQALLPAAPSAALPGCMAPEPALVLDDAAPPLFPGEAAQRVRPLVEKLAPAFDLDPELVMAIIAVESGFNPQSVSNRNARGLMQLIPATAQRFNVRDSFNPEQNIRGGMAYLRWLLANFRGDVSLVAAAYNAGEQAVLRYGGVPPYAETRDYVLKVKRLYRHAFHEYPAPSGYQ